MIVALIIAATLSSDSIGTFFTLPEWMPTEVASVDTPGSDPAGGTGGWYVADMTNKLNDSQWTITGNGFAIEDATITYLGGDSHVVVQTTRDYFSAKYPEYAPHIEQSDPFAISGDEHSLELTWYGEVRGTKRGSEFSFGEYLTATRTNATVIVPTGRYVPRSPRLTEEIMAGVYSTFEAYCERQYFALQGQSNVWDVATYGPRNNTKRFWFDPGTNEYEYVWEPFSHTPSNRTVRTRRLVEYDNIDKLSVYMRDELCGNSYVISGARRPGWINAYQNGESISYYNNGAWWGTTDTSVLTDDKIVPQLSWIRDPTYSIRDQWKGCSMCLANLESDNVWNMWRYRKPLQNMMEKLDFGQSDYYPWWCTGGTVTNTTRDLIETVYPHADGWAITNDTRRLFSDRLCCINQVLGLMDRTFHEPEIRYPTRGTNTTYYNELRCRGVSSGTPTFSSDRYVIGSFTPIAWDQDVITNRISESSSQSSGSAYHHRVSKTATNADVEFDFADASVAPSITPEYGVENDLVSDAVIHGLTLSDGDRVSVAIVFNRMWNGSVVADTFVNKEDSGYDYYQSTMTFTVNITNVNIGAFYTYARSYNYARTVDPLSLGPSQPGFQAGSRFKSGKVGRIIGMHRKTGNISTSLDLMTWSDSFSSAEYDSDEYAFSSRSDLLDTVRAAIATTYNRFIHHYGFVPTAWSSIIPIDASDAQDVRDSIIVERAELTYEEKYVCVAYGYYNVSTQGIDVYQYESWPYSGEDYSTEWRPIAVAKLNVTDYTKSQPTQTERNGLATDTKVGAITRVDWNWKTLKRTED